MTAIHLMHRLAFWRWPKRLICHESTACCQYVDQPNCNIGPRPKGWQNGSDPSEDCEFDHPHPNHPCGRRI